MLNPRSARLGPLFDAANAVPQLVVTLPMSKRIHRLIRSLCSKWRHVHSALTEDCIRLYSAAPTPDAASHAWSVEDTAVTVNDVHAQLGRPRRFELEYDWLGVAGGEPAAAGVAKASSTGSPELYVQNTHAPTTRGSPTGSGCLADTAHGATVQQPRTAPPEHVRAQGDGGQSSRCEVPPALSAATRPPDRSAGTVFAPPQREDRGTDDVAAGRHTGVLHMMLLSPQAPMTAVDEQHANTHSQLYDSHAQDIHRGDIAMQHASPQPLEVENDDVAHHAHHAHVRGFGDCGGAAALDATEELHRMGSTSDMHGLRAHAPPLRELTLPLDFAPDASYAPDTSRPLGEGMLHPHHQSDVHAALGTSDAVALHPLHAPHDALSDHHLRGSHGHQRTTLHGAEVDLAVPLQQGVPSPRTANREQDTHDDGLFLAPRQLDHGHAHAHHDQHGGGGTSQRLRTFVDGGGDSLLVP